MSNTDCIAYQWIGQAVCHCDNCGRPAWEHTHNRRSRPGEGPFGRGFNKIHPARDREIQHLRWKATMQANPGYCRSHDESEYSDLASDEIDARLTELGFFDGADA